MRKGFIVFHRQDAGPSDAKNIKLSPGGPVLMFFAASHFLPVKAYCGLPHLNCKGIWKIKDLVIGHR